MRKGSVKRALLLSSALAMLPAGSALAQEAAPRLTVHGYLTQAYGISRGGMVTGLTSAGTADYRRAAALGRLVVSPSNTFVVQLAHRRLGDSPTMAFEENVKLDMAFFEHQFVSGSKVRIGKTVIPFGIYNETRYAGMLLPFYRAPLAIYWEGTYTSETIDGVLASHHFRAGLPWEFSVDVYGGSFSFLESGTIRTDPAAPPISATAKMQAKNALGTQLWLATPIEGLRLGATALRHTDYGGIYPRPDGVPAVDLTASADASLGRWMLRAETGRRAAQSVVVRSGYAQAGFRPISQLGLNVQSEYMDYVLPPSSGGVTVKMLRDHAAGVNVYLGSSSVLKFEAHRTRGQNVEQVINMLGPAISGSYFIGSFSVSF